MNKGIRLIKRFVALFLVLLLSIESFGAVVSDNDGSAFITKAEFDSLKNNFQAQIDQYNTSIDGKIDGAIASYLAGINVSPTINQNIIFNTWNDYTMVNGSFNNTFGVPKMDLNYIWFHDGEFWSHSYHLLGAVHGNFVTSESAQMYRNVVDVYNRALGEIGSEADGLDTTKNFFVWKGRAYDWTEELSGTLRKYSTGDMPGTQGLQISFCKGFTFTVTDGYHSSGISMNDVWQPKYYWKSNNYDWSEKSLTYSFGSISWSCSASQYKHEHIGNFKTNNSWEVGIPGWNKTFSNSANSNVTSATILSKVSQNGLGSFVKDNLTSTKSYETWMPRTVNVSFKNSSTPTGAALSDKLPSCGIAGYLSANQIQQSIGEITYEFNKKKYNTNPYLLQEGYPLFYATEGTEVTWIPEFSEIGGTGISSNDEVNIVLAYATFGDGFACNNCYITKPNDTSSDNMIWTTNNKRATIKFKMPATGWVVAKWCPASLTYDQALSQYWYATLDNKKSNTVSFKIDE